MTEQNKKPSLPIDPQKLSETLSGGKIDDKGFILDLANLISRNIGKSSKLVEVVETQNFEIQSSTSEMQKVTESVNDRFKVTMTVIIIATIMFGCFGVWMWITSSNLKESHQEVISELRSDNVRMKAAMEASRKQRRANSILFGRLADSFSECTTDKRRAAELRSMAAQVEIMAIKEQMRYHTTPALKKALGDAKMKTVASDPHPFEDK